MGKVKPLVIENITNGEQIYANTDCDYLLVSDTSNFGAYGLVAAVTIELMQIYKNNKSAFIEKFPMFL